MPDYRIKVTVEFTIDIGLTGKPTFFEVNDVAEKITREVFKDSFSRAHLLRVETEELMVFKYEGD